VLMNALRFHDLAVVALRRALEASPPADVADAIRDALAGATTHGEEAVPTVASPSQTESATPAAPADATHPEPRRDPLLRRLRDVARRPYWPLLWRLERNHKHAQWRADGHDQRLDQIRSDLERLEASIDALGGRLVAPPPPQRSEEEVRQMIQELWQMHHMSNEAILEWTALVGRALDTNGDALGNGARH
jgi:hypothetical protein